jgi:hypothetical protein
MATMQYSLKKLWLGWDDLHEEKIFYSPNERGFAKLLPEGRAVIANIPMVDHLHVMDVVELMMSKHEGPPSAGRIIWRGYERKLLLQYPESGGDELYASLVKALQDAGLAAEGLTSYALGLCCHMDSDPLSIIEKAGISLEGLQLVNWTVEALA